VRAEDRQVADDGNPRRIRLDQNLGMLGVARGVEIGLAHHDPDRAAWVHCVGDPPLAPVKHIVIAIGRDRQLKVGGVRRGDLRLGHDIGRTDRAIEQRLEPLFLLRGAAELGQDFHVAGIGGRTIEHLAGPRHAAEQFGNRRIFKVGQPRGKLAVLMRQEQVPQALRLRLGFQVLHPRPFLPEIGRIGHEVLIGLLVGIDMLIHEGADLGQQRLDLVAMLEIHIPTPRPRFF